ncbi:glucokinase [Sphingosinicella rhizophila]|uniref:Glucokinase n=1 Tax=Sphingosinicella rhizophila TaxID=3050082 RepID=A0ABU3Q4K2_9SPHN|nr:glucokinase [Sphingosinicella sp. GR2756]MDT9598341.1 glucokinase [Sphingosinicella sp. GR2756]
MEIVAADIGGTHARFAIAEIREGRVASLGSETTLKTAAHASLPQAWEAFKRRLDRPLPSAAGIAMAGPIQGKILKLTNNPWMIRLASIGDELGVDQLALINDFGAVGHAVAQLDPDHFRHLCGPDQPLPAQGVISIIGPGTGLGVAQLLRRDGHYHVIESEGGHVDFAPLDSLEDRILDLLRSRYRRVSVERVASGLGLANIYQSLAQIEGQPIAYHDERELWEAAMGGTDQLAAAALDRFLLTLGAAAGDMALAHGADAVVIAGGLGARLADRLADSGFPTRFVAKGRFERRMETLPVKLITHPQPGLFGAAAAFAQEFGR